jgi:hypothetical protein
MRSGMRRIVWMGLALMGTTSGLVLAQQQPAGVAAPAEQQPAGSPTGAGSIQQGLPAPNGLGAPGTPGQPAQQGQVGVPQQRPEAAGPTYQGTTEMVPPAQPPVDVGGEVGPGQQQQRAGTGGAGTAAGGQAGAGQQAPTPRSDAALRAELADLRQRVARLEERLEAQGRGPGTGGAGTPDILQRNAGEPDVNLQGPVTLATANFDGFVRAVSSDRIHILDTEGNQYDLFIDRRTRVFDDGERISPRELEDGTLVRASLALSSSGVNQARDIVVMDEPPRRQRQQQQPQQQLMGPGQRIQQQIEQRQEQQPAQ